MSNENIHPAVSNQNGVDQTAATSGSERLKAAVSDVADAAQAQTAVLRQTLEDGTRTAGEGFESVQNSARDLSQSAAATIRQNPVLAVGGALGIGVLVGLALGRGR